MTTTGRVGVTRMQKTESPGFLPGSLISSSATSAGCPSTHQVQTIAPVELSQVFADCEWVAVALQVWGGPATIAATIVTFCEGVKPCSGEAIVAVPAKYAPLLSAAYCSS